MGKVENYTLNPCGNETKVLQKRRRINMELPYNLASVFIIYPKEFKAEM